MSCDVGRGSTAGRGSGAGLGAAGGEAPEGGGVHDRARNYRTRVGRSISWRRRGRALLRRGQGRRTAPASACRGGGPRRSGGSSGRPRPTSSASVSRTPVPVRRRLDPPGRLGVERDDFSRRLRRAAPPAPSPLAARVLKCQAFQEQEKDSNWQHRSPATTLSAPTARGTSRSSSSESRRFRRDSAARTARSRWTFPRGTRPAGKSDSGGGAAPRPAPRPGPLPRRHQGRLQQGRHRRPRSLRDRLHQHGGRGTELQSTSRAFNRTSSTARTSAISSGRAR
jgi:hypothetical protein